MSEKIFEKREGIDFELSEQEIEDLTKDIVNLIGNYMNGFGMFFWW